MSDKNIPFDIQAEIIKSLPVESLIRFRLVSKPWNSLIGSSKFIADYQKHERHHHHLLVRVRPWLISGERENVLIADDNSFPQHKVSLTLPMSVKLLPCPTTVITSQGLVFLHGSPKDGKALIWNPILRKSVDINLCREPYLPSFVFGFGVCPDTCDPKIVKFTEFSGSTREFELFTLSTNAWTTLTKNLPRECIEFERDGVAIDRLIYWFAAVCEVGDLSCWNLIVSFDMTSEEFTEINLPDSFQQYPASSTDFHLYNVRDSLVMVQSIFNSSVDHDIVWKMMEHGVSKSFTKLYSINRPDDVKRLRICGFRTSGQLIVETETETETGMEMRDFFAYDPDSNHMTDIGFPGSTYVFNITPFSYIETLLLLDH